jgi:RHS repeat-associated protein
MRWFQGKLRNIFIVTGLIIAVGAASMPSGDAASLVRDLGSAIGSAFSPSTPAASPAPSRTPAGAPQTTRPPITSHSTAASRSVPRPQASPAPRAGIANLPKGDDQPFGFTGYVKDPESGLYYAGARYYDPKVARFTTEDPFEGRPMEPPSLHRYLYAYANPTAYTDPTGRATEAQFAEMTAQALAAWQQGNRTALGTLGELQLERLLQESGHVIVKGPATNPGAHNADLVAFDPESRELSFFDNKIQSAKETVSKANNLSVEASRQSSISQARTLLEKIEVDPSVRQSIVEALDAAEQNTGSARWIVANANHADSQVVNQAKRISTRLAEKGVVFADVVDDGKRLDVKDAAESVGEARGAKRFLSKAGHAVPVIGTLVTGSIAAVRMNNALAEDYAYQASVRELGGDPAYPFQSSQREAAIITGEEGGSASLATGGAYAGTFCGPAAWACAPAAAVIGGVAGDWAGGKLAQRAFDRNTALSEEQQAQLYQEARRRMERSQPVTIKENPSGQ